MRVSMAFPHLPSRPGTSATRAAAPPPGERQGRRGAVQEQGAGAALQKRARGGCRCLGDGSWGQWERHQHTELGGGPTALGICLICALGLGAAGCRMPQLPAVDALWEADGTIRPMGGSAAPQPGSLGPRPRPWGGWAGREDSPLHRMARLRPRASAVPELMFSTSRCFTFFNTGTRQERDSVAGSEQLGRQASPAHFLTASDSRG